MTSAAAGPADIVYQAGNPGRLPVPRPAIGCLMICVFGVPALMLVATTWREVANYPWLLAVYVGSLFPFAVLFVLSRLMARYALRVYGDGGVEVALPFKRVRVAAGDLAVIALQTATAHAGDVRIRQPCAVLADSDGRVHVKFSPAAFRPEEFAAFLEAVRRTNPRVKLPE